MTSSAGSIKQGMTSLTHKKAKELNQATYLWKKEEVEDNCTIGVCLLVQFFMTMIKNNILACLLNQKK